jgi:hypothetical protein
MDLMEVLEIPARELARAMQREWREFRRRPRGATLRPGRETPLWLALASAVAPHLHRRGARALLARELGLHPSRVSEFFIKKTAMPDAERTLFLLLWLKCRMAAKPSARRPRKSP